MIKFTENMTMYYARRSFLLALLCATLVLPGCDLLGEEDDEDDGPPLAGNVVVGNGGIFGAGNGSLTFYDATADTASTTGSIGGFVTGLALNDDRLYATLNTGFSSGGLAVVNLQAIADGQAPAPTTYTTTTGGAPIGALRALAFADEDRVYATDYNGGGQATGFLVEEGGVTALEDTASMPASYPEGMAYAAGKVFAANYGSGGTGTSLTVFEPGSTESARNVEVPCDGPRELFVDEEDELVVVCSGKTVYNEDYTEIISQTNARVLFMNPETEAVVDRVEFDVQFGSINGSQAASYSALGEVVHAINSSTGQVFRIDTDANDRGGPALTVPDTEGYQGLAAVTYDAVDERLYLARLGTSPGGGYDVKGQVIILDETGTLQGTFETGIAPTSILLIE